jgi:hypothetical protein
VNWSSTLKTRNRRLLSITSDTKSRTRVSFGRAAVRSGARVPMARLRPRRRFVLECLEPRRFRRLHASELCLPFVGFR